MKKLVFLVLFLFASFFAQSQNAQNIIYFSGNTYGFWEKIRVVAVREQNATFYYSSKTFAEQPLQCINIETCTSDGEFRFKFYNQPTIYIFKVILDDKRQPIELRRVNPDGSITKFGLVYDQD
jgi:hypothetical protein